VPALIITGDNAIRGREALMNRTSARLDSAQNPGKFQKMLFVVGPMHPAPKADGVRLHGRQAVHHAITEVCLAISEPISAWMIAEGAMQNSVAS
jgi:hypothetical protein